MKKGLITISVFGIGLSFFIWIYTAAVFPVSRDNEIGSSFFPRLLAVCMIVLCLALLIQTLRKKKNKEAFIFSIRNPAFLRVFITFGASIVFGVLLKSLGFIVCALLLLTGLMYMLGNRKFLQMIIISVITAIAVQLVFEVLLGIVLPYGILEPVFYLF